MTDDNRVYAQRNQLAIAFALMALGMGWNAGRGLDSDMNKDSNWRNVVYVDLPGGEQVSWHIAPTEVPLLDLLPEYEGQWDGTYLGTTPDWVMRLVTVDAESQTEAAYVSKQMWLDAIDQGAEANTYAKSLDETNERQARDIELLRSLLRYMTEEAKRWREQHPSRPYIDQEFDQNCELVRLNLPPEPAVTISREARPGELAQLKDGAVINTTLTDDAWPRISQNLETKLQAKIVEGEHAVAPVDRSNVTLTDGSPVTDDHRELKADGQQKGYVVLSEEERAKGFVRPMRGNYVHKTCGTTTSMNHTLAETYARDPSFYNGTFCVHCGSHYPVVEFNWKEADGSLGPVVGT